MLGKGHQYKGNRISPSQFLMLVILRKGPMYGYEILKVMREEFKGLWEPQTGAIYPALKRLGEHGLIRTDTKEDKEYYGLTEEGAAWVKERLDSMSSELLFMSRYFEVINKAAMDERGEQENAQSSNLVLPMNLRFMMGEEMDQKERLKHLLHIKKMLGEGLENMDNEITKLEKENKEE
jgi:DNA-binding PadR family transcriptional regulator